MKIVCILFCFSIQLFTAKSNLISAQLTQVDTLNAQDSVSGNNNVTSFRDTAGMYLLKRFLGLNQREYYKLQKQNTIDSILYWLEILKKTDKSVTKKIVSKYGKEFYKLKDSVLINTIFNEIIHHNKGELDKANGAKAYMESLKDLAERLKDEKEKEMEEKVKNVRRENLTLLLLIIAAAASLILVGFIVFNSWRQKRLVLLWADYSNYKSSIWQELGHIITKSLKVQYGTFTDKGISENHLGPLNMLKNLCDELFKALAKGEGGVPLSQELTLARNYVDYKNLTQPSNIQIIVNADETIIVPPAIMFSVVRNAIEHGELLNSKLGLILIECEKRDVMNVLIISNNGEPFKDGLSLDNLSPESTGFRNIMNILQYYNKGKIKNPLDWRNIDDVTYTAQTILKIRI